jgi:hypothetical protein
MLSVIGAILPSLLMLFCLPLFIMRLLHTLLEKDERVKRIIEFFFLFCLDTYNLKWERKGKLVYFV